MEDAFELTLYFYPSPYGVDWSSPTRLARSVILNQFSSAGRAIGHVSVELKAPSIYKDRVSHLITGMTQLSKSEERELLIKHQIGMGILFHNFKGMLEPTERSAAEIAKRCVQGNISFLKIIGNREIFDRLHDYLEEYRKRGCDNHYGLPNRPLHGEGGGCSAFAASFLQVCGLIEDEFHKNWTREIRVPHSLIGGPYAEDKKRKVSLLEFLNPFKNHRWAESHEPHRSVFFWDPDLMHRWVQKIWKSESQLTSGRFELTRREKALGLIIDRRNHIVPTSKIWLHED